MQEGPGAQQAEKVEQGGREGSKGKWGRWLPERRWQQRSPGWPRGSKGRGTGAGVGALTAAKSGLAMPDIQVGGFPAGLPQGQVVLVVRGDPGRAQNSSQIQTQRQEDAHQPDQLERGQHRHSYLFHAAASRSHARAPLPPFPTQARTPGGSEEPGAGPPEQKRGGTPAKKSYLGAQLSTPSAQRDSPSWDAWP